VFTLFAMIGWSFKPTVKWWSDRVGATGLALYERKLWEKMSFHWPTADQQPGATRAGPVSGQGTALVCL
jgi:hypothetical protein